MSDSFHDTQCNNAPLSPVKYAKLHSPRMKSVYWQYFGYPTNEDDCIITKQNVVCTLCHKVLTNHGNTTNLRAHLQYRHKDIFNQIITDNHIILPKRKVQPKTNINVNIKREPIESHKIKTEYLDATSQDAIMSATGCNEHEVLYESIVPMTYDDDDRIDNNNFTKVEVNSGVDFKLKQFEIMCEPSNDNHEKYFRDTNNMNSNSSSNEIVYSYQLQEALTNLIVQDVLNIEIIYGTGMSELLKILSANTPIPPPDRIESFIREMYSDKHTSIVDQMKMHSQNKAFSLGFELWSNVERRQFLSIYYNYTTEAPNYNLINQLYCTLEYNKFCVNDEIFEHINMHNCIAAIVNNDCNDTLNTFLKSKNIPIILSYNVIVDYCLKDVFALPAVAAIIEEIKEVMARYNMELSTKCTDIPKINDEFPWTYYELLKFFTENMSWSDEVEILMASAKAVVDCLSPLSVILDTLKGEEVPLSSMLSPITSIVLNKKLTILQDDDKFVVGIKTIVINKFKEFVLSNDHLTIAALLDPRFHRYITIDNITNRVQILSEKFNQINQSQQLNVTTSTGTEAIKTTNVTSNDIDSGGAHIKVEDQPIVKKSNLELFFDLTETSISQPAHSANNVDNELQRYRAEVYVNLDESPFLWWNKMGHLYSSLKCLAIMYQCIPCTVNMNYKKPIKQQIVDYQKRHMLMGNLIDAIIFLHCNK